MQVFPYEYQRALADIQKEEEVKLAAVKEKEAKLANEDLNVLNLPGGDREGRGSLSNMYDEDMINKLEDEDVRLFVL